MLLRAPRSFKTRERKLLWRETCLGLQELGLLDSTSPENIQGYVDALVKMRVAIRVHGGAPLREQLGAIKAVRRTAWGIFAPDRVRQTKGGLVSEILGRLHLLR
jgi:hypothetical protein